jgi:hypothetical protein
LRRDPLSCSGAFLELSWNIGGRTGLNRSADACTLLGPRLPLWEYDEYVGFEVFWQQEGWFWRPLMLTLDGEAVGPFTKSTEAYETACRLLKRRIASKNLRTMAA